jgi:hypothetical protein
MGWKRIVMPNERNSPKRDASPDVKSSVPNKGSAAMKIGLLCGREYSFPPAFIEKVNELGKRDNVTAEFVHLGG